MKRVSRFVGAFLCIFIISALILPVAAAAAQSSFIDTSASSDGYFTVFYDRDAAVKMKVGVTFNKSTKFYSYTHGERMSFAFTEGNGKYTITLYRNVSGTSYAVVASAVVNVVIKSEFAPYLASTSDIKFSENDVISAALSGITSEQMDDAAAVVAIHNFMSSNFVYNDEFAARITAGAVKNYIPDTYAVLESRTGVCYDFSALFAAMCRSLSIPCKIQKGYINGLYHAWNVVYVDGEWCHVDVTFSISRDVNASSFEECMINAADGYTYQY